MVAPAKAAAVVKADGYGLGVTRIAPALYRAGCRAFFVADLGEAVELRPLVAGDAAVYVLNGLQPGTEKACAAAAVIPVLNSLEQVANWSAAARSLGRKLAGVLQLDTGMSRLGLSDIEVDEFTANPALRDGIDLTLIMSHLACADDAGSAANPEQLARLRALLDKLPRLPVSLANSGGAFLPADFHFDLVRPGIALYGAMPTNRPTAPMRPVVRLDARVIQVRSIPPGAIVGYGASFTAGQELRIATLAVGYADGWPRHLGNCGAAYCGAVRLPIVGRVSMDSTAVDVTALPAGTLRLGSLVELIGPHQTLDDVAADSGTIAYEILTRLGPRYSRRYRDADPGAAEPD